MITPNNIAPKDDKAALPPICDYEIKDIGDKTGSKDGTIIFKMLLINLQDEHSLVFSFHNTRILNCLQLQLQQLHLLFPLLTSPLNQKDKGHLAIADQQPQMDLINQM